MSTGIFFGSDNGTTADVCTRLADKLNGAELIDVANAEADDLGKFDKIVLASSTWGDGELQNDWVEFAEKVSGYDFSGKTVALLALGDADSYSDTFCDALYHLKNVAKGATIVGATSTDGYEFENSKGVEDGKFIGLAIDEANSDDLTDGRLDSWATSLKSSGF